jgi:hypothetical protein
MAGRGTDRRCRSSADWGAADNLFAIHNGAPAPSLDLGEHDKVSCYRDASALEFTVGSTCDAAAMLWKLQLRGGRMSAR